MKKKYLDHIRRTTFSNGLAGCVVGKPKIENLKSMLNDFPAIKRIYAVGAETTEYNNNGIIFINTAKEIKEKLDFVYISEDDYKTTKDRLKTYFPFVKHGSIIGGHDLKADNYEFIKAILEFTNKYELSLRVKKDEWFITKNVW